MAATKEQIEEAIKGYIEPHLKKDLVTTKSIKDISIDGGNAIVVLNHPYSGSVVWSPFRPEK